MRIRPRNGSFSAGFSKSDRPAFESTVIFMESVTAPRRRRALLAKRMRDTEHVGNDAAKPNGLCATPGLTRLAATAFVLCSRPHVSDVVGDKLLPDDRMHDLLLGFLRDARAAGEDQPGSR